MHASRNGMHGVKVVPEQAITCWLGGQKSEKRRRLDDLSEEEAAGGWYVRGTGPEEVGQRLVRPGRVGKGPRLARRPDAETGRRQTRGEATGLRRAAGQTGLYLFCVSTRGCSRAVWQGAR